MEGLSYSFKVAGQWRARIHLRLVRSPNPHALKDYHVMAMRIHLVDLQL